MIDCQGCADLRARLLAVEAAMAEHKSVELQAIQRARSAESSLAALRARMRAIAAELTTLAVDDSIPNGQCRWRIKLLAEQVALLDLPVRETHDDDDQARAGSAASVSPTGYRRDERS